MFFFTRLLTAKSESKRDPADAPARPGQLLLKEIAEADNMAKVGKLAVKSKKMVDDISVTLRQVKTNVSMVMQSMSRGAGGVKSGMDLIAQANDFCLAIVERMIPSVVAVEKAYAGAEALDLGMGGVQAVAREINQVVGKLSDVTGHTTGVLRAQSDSMQQLLSSLKRIRGRAG